MVEGCKKNKFKVRRRRSAIVLASLLGAEDTSLDSFRHGTI